LKILLTGASGFVGGSFRRLYEDRDDLEIFGVARSALDEKNYASVDLSKHFDLSFTPDVVIHAAARSSPWGKKSEFKAQNIDATREVIRFCERRCLPKLIYISSGSVYYKNQHQLNMTEESPIGPDFVNAYAATKYAGEELVRRYEGEHVILRPRAVFGPGDTVLFPRILKAAQKGKIPLFKQEGSPAVGDLIYIDVLCDYMLKAAMDPGIQGEYNLTNGEPVEIQEFLFHVFERLDLPKPTRTFHVSTAMKVAACTEVLYKLFRVPWEPPITTFGIGVFAYSKTFDVSKMLRDFGPPLCSVQEGVDRFVDWEKGRA
jgi:2-alkyl-3-oxoalkanoate reductase